MYTLRSGCLPEHTHTHTHTHARTRTHAHTHARIHTRHTHTHTHAHTHARTQICIFFSLPSPAHTQRDNSLGDHMCAFDELGIDPDGTSRQRTLGVHEPVGGWLVRYNFCCLLLFSSLLFVAGKKKITHGL